MKYRELFVNKNVEGDSHWNSVELPDGTRRKMTEAEINAHRLLPEGAEVYQLISLYPVGMNTSGLFPVAFSDKTYNPPKGKSWFTNSEGMKRLIAANRIEPYEDGETLRYVLKLSDYHVSPLTSLWADTSASRDMKFVVQTNEKVVSRCLLMTTDPGDLVFDPTCGSGTTAYIAEQWGRRWTTCDTSRVAITLAKQRLMAAIFDYYELAHPEEGVGSGFRYKIVSHITRESFTTDEPAAQETLYDEPYVDKGKLRVSGPFTAEAVPAPTVRSLEEIEADKSAMPADASVARKGATLRHTEWHDELLKTGLRGKGGHHIDFSRVEPLAGTRWLHADAETKGVKPERVVISFGPEHSLLDRNQVELAWEEARTLSPRPSIIVFAAFEFDPDAAKEIDSLTKEKTGMTFLTAQMNADLLTEDLKKKRASNQSFWLVGRPDVELRRVRKDMNEIEKQIPHPRSPKTGDRVRDDKRKEAGPKGGTKGEPDLYVAEVRGFDYYNTRTGTIESGDTSKIAKWLLDTTKRR